MTSIFGAPMASVLLAVEVLLFEWKPRSLLPVIVAVLTALACRTLWSDAGPLFPGPAAIPASLWILPGAAAIGLVIGLLVAGLSALLYGIEDVFESLPIHWMWWPALGAIVVGVGGLIDPRALGAGYDNIRLLVSGEAPPSSVLLLFAVKAVVWLVALGSGTSGGVLAPFLILGGAVGWLGGLALPGDSGFWAMIGMAAVMSSGMRAPLTGVLFAAEITGRYDVLPVFLAASAVAYGVNILVTRRSILTAKIARRGRHLLQEYGVDPLDVLQAGEVMTRTPRTLPGQMTVSQAVAFFTREARHRSYPLTDADGRLAGLVSRSDALDWSQQSEGNPDATLAEMLSDRAQPSVGPAAPCSEVADLIAQTGIGRIPVVDADGAVVGIITRQDLLRARGTQRRRDATRA
jgi:CBS domain-containing protein